MLLTRKQVNHGSPLFRHLDSLENGIIYQRVKEIYGFPAFLLTFGDSPINPWTKGTFGQAGIANPPRTPSILQVTLTKYFLQYPKTGTLIDCPEGGAL